VIIGADNLEANYRENKLYIKGRKREKPEGLSSSKEENREREKG
jgi:hypothetical protein